MAMPFIPRIILSDRYILKVQLLYVSFPAVLTPISRAVLLSNAEQVYVVF